MMPTFWETWTRDFYKNKRGIKKERETNDFPVKKKEKKTSCPLRNKHSMNQAQYAASTANNKYK